MHFASSSIFIEIDTIWTAKWVSGWKRERANEKERYDKRKRARNESV